MGRHRAPEKPVPPKPAFKFPRRLVAAMTTAGALVMVVTTTAAVSTGVPAALPVLEETQETSGSPAPNQPLTVRLVDVADEEGLPVPESEAPGEIVLEEVETRVPERPEIPVEPEPEPVVTRVPEPEVEAPETTTEPPRPTETEQPKPTTTEKPRPTVETETPRPTATIPGCA